LYLTTTKALSVYLLFIIFFIFLNGLIQRKWTHTIATMGLGLLVVSPWLLRNYYLSGYLIYPLPVLDFFNPDWKIPLALAEQNYLLIKDFAQTEIIRADYFYEGVQNLSLLEWAPQWIERTWALSIGKLFLVGMPVSFIGLIILLFRKNKDKQKNFFLTYIAVVITIWFLSFPSLRFAWSWIISFMMLNLYYFFKNQKHQRTVCYVIIILWALSFLRTGIKTFQKTPALNTITISPIPTATLNNFKKVKMGAVEYTKSETESCEGMMPPCMPYHNPLKIIMKGESINSGFRLAN